MIALRADHQYAKKLAQNEHDALSATTRDRLINAVITRRNRLNKEKDSAELGENNPILLHPSQYSIANPASPGMHAKRTTRLRRDADDYSNLEAGKRKRKVGESDDSTGPSRQQRLENGTSTPIWQLDRTNLAQTQHMSPLYSIEKLFNDRELSMTYNAAAMAAHHHILRHHMENDSDSDSNPDKESPNSQNGKAAIGGDKSHVNGNHAGSPSPPPSSATAMDRQPSHATRSTRAGAGIPNQFLGVSGIELMTDLNYPGNMEALASQTPRLPHPNASVMTKAYVRGDGANQPAGLQPDEATTEIEIMRRACGFNQANGEGMNLQVDGGGRELLEKVSKRWEGGRWLDRGKDAEDAEGDEYSRRDKKGKGRARDMRDEDGIGRGESMSRVNSETGTAAAMSRQATSDGIPSTRRPRRGGGITGLE